MASASATASDTPFADRLMRFLYDDFYVLLDTDSKHVIESASRMSLIYDTLTECFQEARAANDAMVQYGSVWSLMHLEQFRELYDQLGGVDGIAAGLALKHRSELFKVLGSRHGILDRVPDDEQLKLPDGGTASVRVHLRTLDRNEMPSAANPMMAQVKERDIYRESKDSIHFDYSSPEALLDDGWVLD